MENQPPSGARPWFRLASLARMEAAQAQAQAQASPPAAAPAPAPAAPPRPPIQAPVPRIPLARIPTSSIQALPAPQLPQLPPQQQETAPRSSVNGTTSESRQPPRPQKSPSPPPPSPRVQTRVQNPPPSPRIQTRDPTPPPSPRNQIRAPTPPGSPRVIKPSSPTPLQSPRTRQLQPYVAPPSPYPEPEPKAATEPLLKSIITQKESTKGDVKAVGDVDAEYRVEGQAPRPLLRNKTATNGSSATRKKDDGGEIKVITMAGENTGAYMELGSPRPHAKHISGNHLNGNHQQHQGKEGNSEEGNFADKKNGKKEGKPMAVVVNSNVQSVNNSILLSGSCSQHSPGVHFSFTRHHKPQLSKGNATDSSFSKENPHTH